MADLLLNWLNNEIELSKTVTNVEKDFANGYLFGELLFKFNQQSNFKDFSKKNSVAAKQENFKMLEPTLRNLQVKFDSQKVQSVMMEQRGIALQLLYQLKMALEKVYPPSDIAVLRKTGKMGDNQPALKIAPQKEKFDEHAHKFFGHQLQVLNKPQKVLNMEKHLDKFEQERTRQAQSAKKYQQEMLEANNKKKQEIRGASINKLQRNAGFMEEWQQKGVEDWKKNQTIKKDRERRDLEFEYKQAEKYNGMTINKINEANTEVHDGISQFEQTLRNKGINPKVSKEEADKAVSEHFSGSPMKSTQKIQRLSQSLLNKGSSGLGNTNMLGNSMMPTKMGAMTLTSTGLKTKDKKTVDEKTRKDRERRRRKMIVDQGKTHIDMEQKRRESQIVQRMEKQAKQEQELAYESWRTNQCKNVIVEDRKLREARYEKRKELDQQTSNLREEEMLKSMKEQMDRESKTLKDRDFEMRIIQKQAKREKRTNYGQILFDAIFDIANEAYIHQQKSDTEEIDPRNWHEWLQLFIEEQPIQGTLQSLAVPAIEQNYEQEVSQEENPHEKLDQMELVDYLTNKGQWPNDVVTTNKPNLEHILTGQSDVSAPVGGAKGGKAAPAKAAAEQIQLEEGDTELFNEAPNNYILGDAIENIININYEERAQVKRPKMPQFLNLKLCFVGYAFAGKKTQAEKLQAEYGLDVYQLNDLVQEALAFAESNQEPIEKIDQENDEDQYDGEISEDSELVEEYNVYEDFRLCGVEIANILSEGEEISDEQYVKLFVSKLRMTYPHKSKKQLRQELKNKVEKELELQKRLIEIEQELNGESQQDGNKRRRKQNPEQLREESTKLQAQLDQLRQPEKNGWILVDFPSTFAQAKLLETALSGYTPDGECDPIMRESEIRDAYLLVQPNAKEEPSKLLIKSGVDAVIWFDAERQECLRRAVGRRFDNFNEKMYHIEDAPPHTNIAPLCERLVPMDEPSNSEATLIDKWISFDESSKGLENWLTQFGDQDNNYNILSRINSNVTEDQIFIQLQTVINSILEIKQNKENEKKAKIIAVLNAIEAEKEEKQRVFEEEQERRRKLEEEGVDPDTINEEVKADNKVQKPESVTEKLGPKPASLENIDDDFKPVILKLWQELSSNYKRQMKKIFRAVRSQRERMIEQFAHLQKKYLQFLHRPDIKQEKLEQFIKEFNDFSDQYPDLREDDQTKEEMHQRVDILSDEMWEIIEDRKDQDIEERKKIMENGWIEYELAFAVSCSQQLMQAEVDKFKNSISIIHDYYHAFEDKLLPEAPQNSTIEIVAEGEELPPVEVLPDGQDPFNIDLYQYPRLDKLFERALKAQVVPDVTQQQATSQDKKGAPAKGKDPKKPVQEEEKPLEESPYIKQMKEAIKVEKAIFRYRLTLIRNWTLKRLREMRQKCMKVYQKLEDWILVATKTENEAVDEMCVVIKGAIEEERKIQDELRIKFMDFCVDEKIMNYIVPPPQKLPAMEQLRTDRFNISQLNSLVIELEVIANQQGQGSIPNKIIVDLFVRKLENSKGLNDESSLPDDWRQFTEYDFQTMVRNLDKYNTGTVNWKQLATMICLLCTPIATEKDIESFQQEFPTKDGFSDKKTFIKAKAWFDKTESSIDRDYSVPFPRVKHLKKLLFRISKEDKDGEQKINIKKLGVILKAKELSMFKRNLKTYQDIFFAPIEK